MVGVSVFVGVLVGVSVFVGVGVTSGPHGLPKHTLLFE